MTNRYSKGLALARGFTVFIMPAVHSVMLYSSPSVKEGVLGFTLGFLAEGPGAQLFMFLMGVFIVLGSAKTTRYIIFRSVLILTLGYLLNIIRLVIPYLLHWMPGEYLPDHGIAINSNTEWNLLAVGDIFQFASIAYLCCSLLHKFNIGKTALSLIALLILGASPIVWQMETGSAIFKPLLSLFNGLPPAAFFPVFPWIFYPVLGMIFGNFNKTFTGTRLLLRLILVGLFMSIAGFILSLSEPSAWQATFYRTGPGGTFIHGGIVLIWTGMFLALGSLKNENPFFTLLHYLSKHITTIYMAQWIIIMWLFPLFGYGTLALIPSLIAVLITSLMSFLVPKCMDLTYSITKYPNNEKNNNHL